ncbi:hypothetical protein Scep_009844 [Stephania cephalantha]|uniref:Uncharacterized protein n=1 Tax=Stephania cephalantha TaxID=152367 RepID=A0AAP0JVC1_9MAGN
MMNLTSLGASKINHGDEPIEALIPYQLNISQCDENSFSFSSYQDEELKFSDDFLVRLVLLAIGILVLDGFLVSIEWFYCFVVLRAAVVVTDLVKTISGDGRHLITIQPKNFTFLCELNLKSGWRKFLCYVGPGFHVSLAYPDLENLETDLQAGANYGYELLWVVFIGHIVALIIQSLAANLGIAKGVDVGYVTRDSRQAIVGLA